MFYSLKRFIKKIIPRWIILAYHKFRGRSAAYYFGFPARKLRVIGVAGTKGKTSTTNLITRILERSGHKVAMFSTANMRVACQESPNMEKLTTPSPFFLQKFLRDAVKKECDYAVIEVSSHALIQSRLYGIDFAKTVITNLMPDHLDYHKNADEYRDVHIKMIGPKTEEVIVNGDDGQNKEFIIRWADLFKKRKIKVFGYGLEEKDDLIGRGVQLASGSVKFNVEYRKLDMDAPREIARGDRSGNFPGDETISLGEFVLNIPGKFSVYNALAAISLGVSENTDLDRIKKAMICVRGVPGRLENIKVSEKQDFELIVDYAHSPDSLKNVYEAIKPYVKKRLIAVLGGTGDRDKTYRSRGGALADKFADVVIVTNEDPYSEDPDEIMEQVLNGIKNKKKGENLFRILDRREAIKKAVGLAQAGDTILLTGKGSEQFMIWGNKKIPWDDRQVAKEALKGRFGG